MVMKVGFMQLSSCWGCHQSLLDLHEELLDVLPLIEIVYWPAVLDVKKKHLEEMPDASIDVGFIEGIIRTEEDLKNLKLMRKKSKMIVAWGACAVLGGIPGLANLYSKDDLLKRKFQACESIEITGGTPSENVPSIQECVELVNSIIKVDAFIPGCPPTPSQIKSAIYYLAIVVSDEKYPGSNICNVCEMRGDSCILNQDELCFGPITQSIPDLKWTKKMGACFGEHGWTDKPAEPEANKLLNLIINKLQTPLSEKLIAKIIEFIILFLRLSNLGYLYSPDDPLMRLSTKREELPTKKIEIDGRSHTIIDLDLPNYPDITKRMLGLLLQGLNRDPGFKVVWKSVCATCPRNIDEKHLTSIKRDYEGIANQEDCLLEQGYLCMGPATQAGCGALCPRAGVPCLGCYGPTANSKDIGARFLNALASISTELEPEEILKKLVDPAGLVYRFQLPASILHRKISDKKEK